MKANREKGMTLVEILAALTILGIVFVGFMTIFPQMANFNSRTGTKLETMNLAKLELNYLKKNPPPLVEGDEIKNVSEPNESNPNYTVFEYDRKSTPDYHYRARYFTSSDLITNGLNYDAENLTDLYKLHITIEKDNRVISETFGYVHVGGAK